MGDVYVLTSWLASCVKGFELRGWDQSYILKAADISPTIFSEQYCSKKDVFTLFEAAESLYGSSAGLESRRGIVPNSFYSLSLAMLAAENLRDGLRLMVKYNATITNAYDCYFNEGVENAIFGFKLHDELVLPSMVSDAIMSTAIRTFRFVQPQKNAIRKIDLAKPKPKNTMQYERYFKAPINWASEQFAIHLCSDCLALPSMHAHPEILTYNENKCIERLRELDPTPFLLTVEVYVRKNLERNCVSIDQVAAGLEISVRTLQRSLQNENTSFKHLLDEIRRGEAQKYIETTPLSITQIAHNLGFSDSGNFTRAFKRWYNCSPNQYRQQFSKNICSQA